MDSKVLKIAVMTICFFMVIIMGLVIFLNMDEITQKEKTTAKVTENNSSGFKNGDTMSEEELRLFVEDDTFFDKKKTSSSYTQSGTEVTLMVTSVEKDLRIKVVDSIGKPITGTEFCVSLEGVGDYEDNDRDGMIHISDLTAGEYYASLEPVKGYQVPESKIAVSVKNQVEYTAIQDISYFIMSEDEIDALLDDTGEKTAEVEADDTENSVLRLADGNHYFGIDVSKWNKEINWSAVKSAGVDFAIIRCGYRGSSTGSLVEDPYFLKNITGATEAGIKVGLYFFTQATTEVEAVEEASMAIMLANDYQLDYPIFIDTEGAGGNGRADDLGVEARTAVCKAFSETIIAAGYQAGIYASKNWYENQLYAEELSDYVIWMAQYSDSPTYEGDYLLWQYTSKGSIDGINGNVDLNISYLR